MSQYLFFAIEHQKGLNVTNYVIVFSYSKQSTQKSYDKSNDKQTQDNKN